MLLYKLQRHHKSALQDSDCHRWKDFILVMNPLQKDSQKREKERVLKISPSYHGTGNL